MRRLLLLALLAGLSGCATTEATAPVGYTLDPAASHGAALHLKVSVLATDARTTNRGRISTKVNGYGMEMAAIRAQEPVEKTVSDALSQELAARGYDLAAGGVTLNAGVETFYNQFKVGAFSGKADGEVQLKVTVTDAAGATLFTRVVKGEHSKSVQLASGSNAAESISLALREAIHTLFADEGFVRALAGTASGTAEAPVA